MAKNIESTITEYAVNTDININSIQCETENTKSINAVIDTQENIIAEVENSKVEAEIKAINFNTQIIERPINVTLTEIDLKAFESVFGVENEIFVLNAEQIQNCIVTLKYKPFAIIGVRIENAGGSMIEDIHYTRQEKNINWFMSIFDGLINVNERLSVSYLYKK